MEERARWAMDGALAGWVPGLLLGWLLSEGWLLAPSDPAPWTLQDPAEMWAWLDVFLLLTTLLGALAGWGILDSLRLRKVVPGEVAPLLFALVGMAVGLVVSVLWLLRFAEWPVPGHLWCPVGFEEGTLWPTRIGSPVVGVWTLGTALWAPVFGVLRLGARGVAERARAVVATWCVSLVAVPIAYVVGGSMARVTWIALRLLS